MTAALSTFAPLRPAPPPAFVVDEAAAVLARWRVAFPALDALIAAGAAPGVALRRLGLTFWSAGQTVAAAEVLGQAVVWSPADAAVWLDLGFARRAAQNPAGAVEAFDRATQLAPLNARAWLALGLALREQATPQRAEAALEKALALDPACDEAAYSLGLIAFDARRYAEAARHWRAVVARGFSAPGLWLGLGQCQFFLGEFGAAAVSLARHMQGAPEDAAIARRLALVVFLEAAIRGGAQAGRAAYEAQAGLDAPFAAIVKTAVQLLSAYGYVSTARDVAQAFMREEADDPIHRHHLAALAGESLTRAPAEYVAAYFDHFAETFDQQLYGVLQYRGPQKLCALLAQTGAPTGVTLDLGCGAGAAGPLLRPRASRLVGVDLSANMLAKARARGTYDELVRADMVDYLDGRRDAFDLIFAADSLIYLGDLEPFLAAAARALRPGGMLALTLETSAKPYELTISGRFAHAPRGVIATGAALGLSLRATRRAFLRLEAHRRLYGALVILERRG